MPTDIKVLSAVGGVGNQVGGLKDLLATNPSIVPPDARVAILETEQKDAAQEENAIKARHELINFDSVSLKMLRGERDMDLAQQEKEKTQATIQQQIDDIKNKQKMDEDAKREKEAAQLERQKKQENDLALLKKQKLEALTILPLFDYVVTELDKMVEEISKEAGEGGESDFAGTTPSIYASGSVKDGVIISATNHIWIGTNSAWSFEISTARSTVMEQVQNQHRFANRDTMSLNLVSLTTNGESRLTVTPVVTISGGPPKIIHRKLVRVSVKLNIPNGLNIDETQQFTEYTNSIDKNYMASIDKALRRLIEGQDQQCPLPQNTK